MYDFWVALVFCALCAIIGYSTTIAFRRVYFLKVQKDTALTGWIDNKNFIIMCVAVPLLFFVGIFFLPSTNHAWVIFFVGIGAMFAMYAEVPKQ